MATNSREENEKTLALTSADVSREIARYAEVLTYGQNAHLFPFADFYQLHSGETFLVAALARLS